MFLLLHQRDVDFLGAGACSCCWCDPLSLYVADADGGNESPAYFRSDKADCSALHNKCPYIYIG